MSWDTSLPFTILISPLLQSLITSPHFPISLHVSALRGGGAAAAPHLGAADIERRRPTVVVNSWDNLVTWLHTQVCNHQCHRPPPHWRRHFHRPNSLVAIVVGERAQCRDSCRAWRVHHVGGAIVHNEGRATHPQAPTPTAPTTCHTLPAPLPHLPAPHPVAPRAPPRVPLSPTPWPHGHTHLPCLPLRVPQGRDLLKAAAWMGKMMMGAQQWRRRQRALHHGRDEKRMPGAMGRVDGDVHHGDVRRADASVCRSNKEKRKMVDATILMLHWWSAETTRMWCQRGEDKEYLFIFTG